MKSGKCWGCGTDLTALDYGRADRCKTCGKDTKVCRNCTFYDRSYNNECREPQAERVVDKERSCFCEYFNPSTTGGSGPTRDALKSAAEALFRKKS
jgi:hypothetical protein